ncbi:MAG: amino acid ABC transporter permease [Candidatus Ancillula sp.]|jgi:glutamate transport system permease protein|nr:amino acid ABC transporter permease [Candidatus Ancillula sp.]
MKLHASDLSVESLAPGVEGSGLLPENVKIQTPALHRPKDKGTLLFDIPGKKALRKIRVFNILGGILLIMLLIWIGMVLASNGQFAPELWGNALSVDAWTNFYIPGLLSTLEVSVLAILASILFGLFFGSLRVLPSRICRAPSATIVEFSRAVPVLLFMVFFWRFFSLIGVGEASSFWAVFFGLLLYNGSVIAELLRSGVNNLPKGQREASLSLGLTRTQSLLKVELPQSVKSMIPALVTQLVVVLKDTALGSIIMYTDLLQETRRLASANFNVLQAMTIATLLYFAICFALTRAVEHFADKWGK